MKLCEMVKTDKCVLHEANIPYPPSVETLETVVELIGKCELVDSLGEAKCPYAEWAEENKSVEAQPDEAPEVEAKEASENEKRAITIESVLADIAQAETLSDLMAIETEKNAPQFTPEPMTVSIGVFTSPDKRFTADECISFADKALYVAKRSGRNRVVVSE